MVLNMIITESVIFDTGSWPGQEKKSEGEEGNDDKRKVLKNQWQSRTWVQEAGLVKTELFH